MSDTEQQEFKGRLQGVVEGLARALDDPREIAAKAAEWLGANEPERLSTAVWIDIDGDKDRGFEVRLFERALSVGWVEVQPGLLIGENSAGVNLSAPIFTSAKGVRISAGLGAVTPLDIDTIGQEWKPVATLSVRVPLG